MKTFNTIYTNEKDLIYFLQKNNISNDKKILLQMFSGECNKKTIEKTILLIVSQLPNIKIIGTTTNGEILDTNIYNNTIILSFSVFEETNIEIYSSKYNPDSKIMAKNIIGHFKDLSNTKVAIIFLDGIYINAENFLNEFKQIKEKFTISGGLSGDNGKLQETFVFDKNGIIQKGAVVALLNNPDLIVQTKYNFGWKEAGKELTITNAHNNIVYSINNENPIDIYKKYFENHAINTNPLTYINFPLILKNKKQPIARTMLKINEDSSVTFSGNLKKGNKVYIGFENLEAIQQQSISISQSLSYTPIESVFIYSCLARKKILENNSINELASLKSTIPLSGFFSYGEIYGTNKNSSFFNETMTLLTLSENQNHKIKNLFCTQATKKSESAKILDTLSHFSNNVFQELEETNLMLEKMIKKEHKLNRKKDEQLFEQSKYAQMGEMLNMIAHQWRQPINAISASMIKLNFKNELNIVNSKDITYAAEFIQDQTQEMSQTINDFMNFFKKEGKKESFLLNEALKIALNIINAQLINRNINLNINIDMNTTIYGHKKEFSHVLLNLLSNAKDAFESKKNENKKICIGTNQTKENLKIFILDNAGGIEENIINKIFNPYFTTKEQGKGTGIGLYMTKQILEKNFNAEIMAFNKDDGAIFEITIPITNEINNCKII